MLSICEKRSNFKNPLLNWEIYGEYLSTLNIQQFRNQLYNLSKIKADALPLRDFLQKD